MYRPKAHLFVTTTIIASLFATQSTHARQSPRTYRTLGEAILAASRTNRSETGSGALQAPPTFDQEAYLKASSIDAFDHFGKSVAVSGDTAVVGVPGESSNARTIDGDSTNNSASQSGAAYVFVRTPAGWIRQAYLKASDASIADNFGTAVAISGDTIVVGAPGQGAGGGAYVFVRNPVDASWSQESLLNPSNEEPFDQFGSAVAVSGDTVVVGTPNEDSNATGVGGPEGNNLALESGAAYIFRRVGTTWTQQAYLKASNTDAQDNFGFSVGVSGDTVVVGAYRESSDGIHGQGDNGAAQAGAAYVFARTNDTWSQQAYLKASNATIGDIFGYSVGVSGDTIVVGAMNEDSTATGVNGDQNNNSSGQSGAAYVFVRNGTTWTQQAYVKASNTGTNDQFGASVAIDRNLMVVGAINEDIGVTDFDNSGAAYVFLRTCGVWQQKAYLKAANAGSPDNFGTNVAVSGGTVVVGAWKEDGSATGVNGRDDDAATEAGAAYAFSMSNTAPTITPLPVTRWPDTTSPDFTIATVGDDEEGPCSLDVSVQSANPSNGTTLSSLSNTDGTVTATIVVAPGASSASFVLRVTDLAGAFTETTVNVTVVPPVTITPTITPAANANGWHKGPVSVTWSIANHTFIQSGCDPTTLAAEPVPPATGTTLTCTAGNDGGKKSESVTVRIDLTPPTGIATRSPLPNANGWTNTDVTVKFECTDALSGPPSAITTQTITTQGVNQSRSSVCTDLAGNSATVAITGINIDKTAPVVTATSLAVTPNPATVNAPVSLKATLVDTGFSNLNGAEFTAGGTTYPIAAANASAIVTGAIGAFASPGVVTACVRTFDRAGNQSADACFAFTVFDPNVGVQVQPGEVLVMEPDGPSNLGTVFRVDPETGRRLILTDFGVENTGGQDPRWIAVDRIGRILVVDQSAGTDGWGALKRIDPSTTNPATLRPKVEVLSDFGNETQGPPAGNPQGVAVEADGHILVVDAGAATVPPRPPSLFRIDPQTGSRTGLSTFANSFPTSIAIERNGNILVLDQALNGRLLRIDPITGNQLQQLTVFTGLAPRGIAVEASGSILLAEIATGTSQRGTLFRVNPVDGSRTVLSDFGDSNQGALGENPQQVAVAPDGWIFVTDQFVGTSGAGALFRVNPVSGFRDLISDFGDGAPVGVNPFGVAVVPPPPGRLIVIKDVVNDNGGTHVASDWTMTVVGGRPNPASFTGATTPGTTVLVDAGAYSVSELGPQGYGSTPSADCSGMIAAGETKTCTLTSNDLPATLIVIKDVVNDNGGTAVAADWTMTVAATNASPAVFAGAASPGTIVTFNPGPYAVTETGPTGYVNTLSAGCTGTLNAGETKTCTATSDDKRGTLMVVKNVVNDSGGSRVAADWTFTVTGANPSPATFPGSTSPGTAVQLDAGAYDVTEMGPSGYATTRSAECTGNIGVGEVRTCTSSSDDQDLTPPDTTITSSPPATTTSTSATFGFSSTEAGTFECSLDGAAFATCVSPQTYEGVAIGAHTFAVRAVDGSGNVDPTPASYSWTVQPVLVTLTVTKSGSGTGTVTSTPPGIDCGTTCAAGFAPGTTVTLTALPDTGSTFTSWSGAADCADGIVTTSVALTCTATFAAVALPDLTISSLMIQGPKNIPGSSVLPVNSTVANTATGTAAPSTVSFYLSSNNTFEAGSDQLLASRAVPQLGAKATSSATTSVTLPTGLAPGDWFIVAVVDASGAVAETDETNNAASKAFKIKK